MKLTPVFVVALLLAAACQAPREGNLKRLMPVSFSSVTIDDDFWTPRLLIHKDVTLPVCIDQIENRTGRIRNFENAAKGEGAHSGIFFDDSDVYKALEGMAYSLQIEPDPRHVRQALEEGKIRPSRYESYARLWEQANRIKDWERKEKE